MTASDDRNSLVIRDPARSDETNWRRLWAGYCAFYETDVPEAVTAATWKRMLTPGSPLFGRIAQLKGEVAGFTISVIHEGSWTLHSICYLEDLFVAPKARGHGIGRALIEDLLALAKERHWSRLYWHTREGNAPARRLYDEFAIADDFVRYRLALDQAAQAREYRHIVVSSSRPIDRARDLLSRDDKTISEIAYAVGFSSQPPNGELPPEGLTPWKFRQSLD